MSAGASAGAEERRFGTVALAIEPPLAWLTLSRPHKLNALDQETLEGIAAAAHAVDAASELAVAIVRGEGPDFSAGADIRAAAAVPPERRLEVLRQGADAGRVAMAAVRGMRPVTIALVHGRAVGGAMVLAAACDLRVVTDDADFWLPEVDLGIPVGWGGVPILVEELGPALARDLVLTCRHFGAAEAQQAGFVSRLVSPERATEAARELALAIAAKPAGALTRSKQQFGALLAGAPSGAADADLIVSALAEDSRTTLGS